MFLIDIKKLKLQIKENSLTEKESLHYLLGNVIVSGIGTTLITLTVLSGVLFDITDVIYDVISLIISILGFIYLYKKNKGDSGKDFLIKLNSIYFVLSLRFLTAFFIALIPAVGLNLFLDLILQNELLLNMINLVIFGFFDILFFYRIGVHLEETN